MFTYFYNYLLSFLGWITTSAFCHVRVYTVLHIQLCASVIIIIENNENQNIERVKKYVEGDKDNAKTLEDSARARGTAAWSLASVQKKYLHRAASNECICELVGCKFG